MRRTDARRRERDGPEGVVQGFQVSVYKVDPRLDSLTRNLFSKDDWRRALLDEPGKRRPKVPWVLKPKSIACRGERLARTGTGPNRSIICPAGAPKGEGPDTDAGEEVALLETAQVAGVDILDTPFIHDAWRDVAGVYQVAQPLSGIGVYFVVISGQGFTSPVGVIRVCGLLVDGPACGRIKEKSMVNVVEIVLELEGSGFINTGRATRARVVRSFPDGVLTCQVDDGINGVSEPKGTFENVEMARDAIIEYWDACNIALQKKFWRPKMNV